MKTFRTQKFDRAFTALIPLLISIVAYADEPSITGIYSNMEVSGEEDIAGMEMFIVASQEGYFATVQCSLGEPVKPVLTKLAVNGLSITGSVPDSAGCEGKSFRGVIGKTGLDIVFDKSQNHQKLVGGKSFWITK